MGGACLPAAVGGDCFPVDGACHPVGGAHFPADGLHLLVGGVYLPVDEVYHLAFQVREVWSKQTNTKYRGNQRQQTGSTLHPQVHCLQQV